MNREVLERPFDAELIKSRQGPQGRTFSYVEGVEYIRRLNEAFDGQWSFEIAGHWVLENEVVVQGKLSADGVTKMTFGGSTITMIRDSGNTVSIADDLKSAATDALKKAASLFGVGLHLYSEPAENNGGNGKNNGGNGNGNGNGNGRITQRQHAAIISLARQLGQSTEAVRTRTIQLYGAPPESLSSTAASDLIKKMQAAVMNI